MTVMRVLMVTLLKPSPCCCSNVHMRPWTTVLMTVVLLKAGRRGKGEPRSVYEVLALEDAGLAWLVVLTEAVLAATGLAGAGLGVGTDLGTARMTWVVSKGRGRRAESMGCESLGNLFFRG